jgi:hypothetical protein
MFTSAVVARRRVPAATWSSIWYLLSSFAVISYTENWVYMGFAAVGRGSGRSRRLPSCIGRPAGLRSVPRRNNALAGPRKAIHFGMTLRF